MKPEEDSFQRLGHILEQQFMCREQTIGCSEGNLVNDNSRRSSKKGSSRKCNLKISRDSHKIRKRASTAPPSSVQIKRPIIIYTYSPKVIHTQPSNFMWLVQSLTGSSETRSRCFKSRPSELTADAHAAAAAYSSFTTLTTTTMDTENSKPFGSSLGMNNHARASPPHHGSREADFHQKQFSAARITRRQLQANDETSLHEVLSLQQLSSSYRITKNVSPRSPFSTTEFEDAAPFLTTITTTARAPAFDNWSLDQNYQLHNNTTIRSSSGLPQGPCLNYISNLSHAPHHLSENHGLPFSYAVNTTSWTVDSPLLSNKPIPIWEYVNDVM